MSSVYATEPVTTGRVILETTHGPLDISLWCRECPLVTKQFLQLCLDGFYTQQIFHRVVPNFLIQTGLVRATTAATTASKEKQDLSQEDAQAMQHYRETISQTETLSRVPYELHSRLRFHHRGQIALAVSMQDLKAKSPSELALLQFQFFITLDEAMHLNGQHVVFGTIASSPTMFNALRIAQTVEVDPDTNTVVDVQQAPRITDVKIVDSSFFPQLCATRLVPWNSISVQEKPDEALKKFKKKRKGKLDKNVLSFGDDMMEDDDVHVQVTTVGIRSSHDVLASQSSKAVVATDTKNDRNDAPSRKKTRRHENHIDEDEKSSERDGQEGKVVVDDNAASDRIQQNDDNDDDDDRKQLPKSLSSKTDPQGSAFAARIKKSNHSNDDNKNDKPHTMSAATAAAATSGEGRSVVEARRAKYAAASRKNKKQRQEDTLAKMLEFQNKVKSSVQRAASLSTAAAAAEESLADRMARRAAASANEQQEQQQVLVENSTTAGYHGQVLESDEEEGDVHVKNGNKKNKSWLSTRFQCRKHLDQMIRSGDDTTEVIVVGGDGRFADDYQVVDEQKRRGENHQHQHKRKHDRYRSSSSKNDRQRHEKHDK